MSCPMTTFLQFLFTEILEDLKAMSFSSSITIPAVTPTDPFDEMEFH